MRVFGIYRQYFLMFSEILPRMSRIAMRSTSCFGSKLRDLVVDGSVHTVLGDLEADSDAHGIRGACR